METNERGIVFYEPTDPVSPLHTLLNAGQTSVDNALAALEQRIAQLEDD